MTIDVEKLEKIGVKLALKHKTMDDFFDARARGIAMGTVNCKWCEKFDAVDVGVCLNCGVDLK